MGVGGSAAIAPPPAVSQHLSFPQLLTSGFIHPKLWHTEMLNSGCVSVVWVHGDSGAAMGWNGLLQVCLWVFT